MSFTHLLWLAIGIPTLGSVVSRPMKNPRARWGVGLFATFAAVALLAILSARVPESSELLRTTPLTFVIALAMGISFFCLQLAAPRSLRSENAVSNRLAMEAMAFLCLFANDLRLFFVAWAILPLPIWTYTKHDRAGKKVRGAYFLFQMIGNLCFAAALLLLWRAGGEVPQVNVFNLSSLAAGRLDDLANIQAIGCLVALAAFLRQGLFPFQTGLIALVEWAPLDGVVALLATQSGLVALLRVGGPLLRSVVMAHHQGLMALGVTGLVYLSVLVAAKKVKFRRLLAVLSITDASFVLVGIGLGQSLGFLGEGLQWVTSIVTIAGLGTALWLLEERVGNLKWSSLGGLAKYFPILGGFVLTFGLAALHVPLTLGFVSEDLLVQGLIDHAFGYGIAVLGSVALLGISVVRFYFNYFLGPTSANFSIVDIRPRERLALGLLFALLVGFGIFPRAIVDRVGPQINELGYRRPVPRYTENAELKAH